MSEQSVLTLTNDRERAQAVVFKAGAPMIRGAARAEIAELAIEHGVDADWWRRLMPAFAAMLRACRVAYRWSQVNRPVA